jgi:HPr kinase/phosphorylase
MSESGLPISEFIDAFSLEVLNRGGDFDSAMLTITDVNRPGLQFLEFYDYFDPRRLQVIGKAEFMFLKGLDPEKRKEAFDNLFLYDIPALVIARSLDCFPECIQSAQEHEKTLLRSEETTVDFTSHAIEYLNRQLAPTVHATAFCWTFTARACC